MNKIFFIQKKRRSAAFLILPIRGIVITQIKRVKTGFFGAGKLFFRHCGGFIV